MVEYECGFPLSITVCFRCPKCDHKIEEIVYIPNPDFSSDRDTFSSTRSDDWFDVQCSNCGMPFNLQTTGSCCGGTVFIEDLPDDYPVEFIEETDYDNECLYLGNGQNDYYSEFKKSMDEINELINYSDFPYQKTLFKLLYIQIVVCLETFLYEALRTKIITNEQYKQLFVEQYKDFNIQKIKVSDIYKTYSKIDDLVFKTLAELLYHQIPKIKAIYEKVLSVMFPDISSICKIVKFRHNLVHHNGRDENGVYVELTKEQLTQAYSSVHQFVDEINQSLETI